ncbi:MAG: Ppx/GppA family phosphatase [Neomegalonema sp.]|nr:Ppx/GppA family phosphatase [Neomegalonema sp.]
MANQVEEPTPFPRARRTPPGEADLEPPRADSAPEKGRAPKERRDRNGDDGAAEATDGKRPHGTPRRMDAPKGPAGPPQRGNGQSQNRSARQSGADRAVSKRRRRGPCIAALDLGTNNCRILIARADGASFQVIDAFSRVVRLGEKLAETGRLADDAMDRAVSALSICADRIRKHRVVRFRAIATEACRRASNCAEFLRRVEAETGLKLDVIDAAEEARLAVAGCAPLIDPAAEQLVVFDIGGGSTELIRVDLAKAPPAKRKALLMALAHGDSRSDRARAAGRYIADWVSLPIGVVTLGELFPHPDDASRFHAMEQHVNDLLTPFAEAAGFLDEQRDIHHSTQLLGASGTITTLAGVHLGLDRYERHRVDGLWIAPRSIDRIIGRLVDMNGAQRAAIPCIGQDRATNLMSGAAILRAILRSTPARRLRVADRGLREGVLYGLAEDGRSRPKRRRRGRSE